MKKIGLLGLTDGNGHPYSWGSIINGYNDKALRDANWDVIYNYVKKRDISEFGFPNIKITHVWTQDDAISNNLAQAIGAESVVKNYTDMIGEVDAVIIARDDYEQHLVMAKPFLDEGMKVLIDKPLTMDISELLYFKEFLSKGQLMSVAGLRFAIELDEIRANMDTFGKLKVIQSSVINEWEKYGIHIIDGVLGLIEEKPKSIEYISSNAEIYVVTFDSGLVWTINILGRTQKTFNIEVWGESKRSSVEIEDNFSMFRRMLYRFGKLVDKNEILYNPENTLLSIALLIAGKQSRQENRKIILDELYHCLGIEGY
ncbi:Gfo/Idh/MocA family oxidoreductase [Lysinibacillus sphaericus]|uniref:Gfo/Idh/MocA family oxidoreductase n=1 Tax=Lysinibacillus sphaericus TaxID=1421 RepID=UPI0004DF5302|nr:Gfo/Idh/MocA family oxidoreductase [Lysinibacillus sphaericus]QPA59395.1 Gfo/Idh/MocA family oxidoreductase [Lysinibacillus sphaericus]